MKPIQGDFEHLWSVVGSDSSRQITHPCSQKTFVTATVSTSEFSQCIRINNVDQMKNSEYFYWYY